MSQLTWYRRRFAVIIADTIYIKSVYSHNHNTYTSWSRAQYTYKKKLKFWISNYVSRREMSLRERARALRPNLELSYRCETAINWILFSFISKLTKNRRSEIDALPGSFEARPTTVLLICARQFWQVNP